MITEIPDTRAKVLCLESEIYREIGFAEGIGYSLPESVQNAFFDNIDALYQSIEKLLELI